MRIAGLFVVITALSGAVAVPIESAKGKVDRYLVQMKERFTVEKLCAQDDKVKALSHFRDGIDRNFSFGNFEAFSGKFSKEALLRMASNPMVAKIVPDSLVQAVDIDVEYDAPPHLVRLSQDDPVTPDESEYFYDTDFQGQNVNAYIIDSGVFVDHPQFEGRASNGPNYSEDLTNADFVGHGTHVAGLIGSKTFGVAKEINLISVKVLDKYGQGSLSSVIAGLQFAVKHRKESGNVPGVANLSLGAAKSSVLDDAVKAAYQSGLVIVVAAGNSNIDACNTSPAGSPFSYTVGAIDDTQDKIASFSNWGKCVNIFSSGVEVQSLSNSQTNLNKVQTLSGTSMASPVVAGVIGVLLSKGVGPDDIVSEMDEISISSAIPRISLLLRPGSPNRIASNGVREDDFDMLRFSNSSIQSVDPARS
ncbi:hypothetical protein OGAPHI_001984 [Ogataea philodendri]|uniref:Peptidase S8/S53 domain-containing protein n=1 Tax=Ogataea philodendri TaxID=1378263 RepID=A0A9P8PAY2_9ASCO|nr:uncharacterized protein OGAPHI_001984 [Ogataea philodendri]KAH3668230.1 hypothetical protein OGAPHI_001984 [Ogataea philodendri]